MAPKLSVADARSLYKEVTLNGHKYSYILSEPKHQAPIDTIFLIHGFPDLSFGWRNQIPFLTSLGLRVVVPDMIGYGGTDAPEDFKYMSYKSVSDDLAALAKELGLSRIILGGHDWGGAFVYRFAIYYPELISAVFSVCTPFRPPTSEYVDQARAPNFKYQIQLREPEFLEKITGEKKIRQFLNAMYGGRSPDLQAGFSVDKGAHYEKLEHLNPTRLMNEEELDFYAERFAIHGMRGPTNWYRTGKVNWEEETALGIDWKTYKIKIPFLYIAGTRDAALPPALASGMEKWFRSLTKGEVDATHWALWEKPDEVNQYIKEFLFGQVGGSKL